MRDELRRDLFAAIRTRDEVAVSALRAALAAIENAEAVDTDEVDLPGPGTSRVAGALVGVGAGEARRRDLTAADVERIVRAEIAELLTAAAEYERRGRSERAARLRAEADVLGRHVA